MSDEQQKDGGTPWELQTAGAAMIAARHAGDVQAEVTALLRFSEGLRNSSLGVVGQVIEPIAADMRDQKRALDTMVTTMQHIAAVVVQSERKASERFTAIEHRLDTKRAEIDQIKEQQAVLAHEQAALAVRLARLEARTDG